MPPPDEPIAVVGAIRDEKSAIQQACSKAKFVEIQPEDCIDEIVAKLKPVVPVDHILWIAPDNPLQSLTGDAIIHEQNQGVLQVFRLIKALLFMGYGSGTLSWTLITRQTQAVHKSDSLNPTHASISGLVETLAKEYPAWKIRLIDLEENCNLPIAEILTLPTDTPGKTWLYRNMEWLRQELIPVREFPVHRQIYKYKGVYVVIGGAGEIGEIWSRSMIRKYQARIIWIGRRKKDAPIQSKLDSLASHGPAPWYITADAGNQQSLQKAYEKIKQRHPMISGVIHSAMILSDQNIENLKEEDFQSVFSAKTDVSVCMAQVFQKEPLDFVLFFSSVISFIKNPKESHYASGCTFQDAFAHQLDRDWHFPVKVINWGYWSNTKQMVSKDYLDRLLELGVGFIEPSEAMNTLEMLLAGPMNQLALMKTTKSFAIEKVNPEEQITVYPESFSPISHDILRQMPRRDFDIQRLQSRGGLKSNAMDALLCKLLLGNLQSTGFFKEKVLKLTDLKTNLYGHYNQWFEESISLLVQNNYLRYDGDMLSINDSNMVNMAELWKEWDREKKVWNQDVNKKAQVSLAEACLKALPKILAGKQRATDIIFPNASMTLVEGIYKGNRVSDYFNSVLTNTLMIHIKERLKQEPSAKFRILEIGAGTGGTTAAILPQLHPLQNHIQEYCYTDISKAFLIHADEHYVAQYPYMRTHIFDIEKPVSAQNIQAGKYDVVIAANVLHATEKISKTLRNAKAALQKNGLILLNELSCKSLFTHLTFGLLEGWWLYKDTQLRIPGCPGLYPDTWKKILETEGFFSVMFPAEKAHELGQQIIVAQSDGIIRQKLVAMPDAAPVKKRFEQQETKKVSPPSREISVKAPFESLREKSTLYFKKLVASTLRMPSHQIDSSLALEQYGIDSILAVQLTDVLRNEFKDVSSTLFFEVQTIDALVDHFIKTRKEELIQQVGFEDKALEEKIFCEVPPLSEPLSKIKPKFGKSGRFMSFPELKKERVSQVRDVAIIGLSGRYPQAKNLNEFWNNLKEGKDCITEIPKERWDWRDFFDEERGKTGSHYTKWGGFMEDVDKFDPLFFQISPREAEKMNPQERLFLEAAYTSIEDAGYTAATLL